MALDWMCVLIYTRTRTHAHTQEYIQTDKDMVLFWIILNTRFHSADQIDEMHY